MAKITPDQLLDMARRFEEQALVEARIAFDTNRAGPISYTEITSINAAFELADRLRAVARRREFET